MRTLHRLGILGATELDLPGGAGSHFGPDRGLPELLGVAWAVRRHEPRPSCSVGPKGPKVQNRNIQRYPSIDTCNKGQEQKTIKWQFETIKEVML